MESAATELPLFPLQTVLLPSGLLALRVFESRYLDMVGRCLRGTNRFGVIAIRQGAEVGAATTYDVGTAAEIVDWHQEAAGILGLRAVGREEFRVLATRREPDGLYVARVAWPPPLPALALPAEHAPLAALLCRLLTTVPLYRDEPMAFDDGLWVAGRLIELLPLPLAVKQSLLETRDGAQRLARLVAALRPAQRPQ